MGTGWENGNLFERVMIRHGEMADERRPYEDDFADIIEVFNPGLTEFEERTDKQRIRDTFDGTPASALQIMADGLQSSIVSRSIAWLRYTMPDQRLKGVDEVIAWLQACEEHMYPVYARSGFYPALGPYFRAGLSVGTPAMISEENIQTKKIECIVPHPRENFFRFDSFGVPIQYHRAFEKTLTQLVIELKERGIPTTALSATTQTAITNGSNPRVKLLQVYYRDDDPIFSGLEVSGELGDRLPQRPWRTYIMEIGADAGTDDGKKKPFEAAGYGYRPHAVWRYEISTDEIYARTPAWFSLHDARGEIQASKTLQEAAEGYVRPSYLASSDMRGKIRRKPGSTTYLATSTSKVDDMPNAGKNYPISDKERDRMVANVERWFDVAFYQMLMRNMLAGGTPPSATQIIGVEGEAGRQKATKVERIVNDALTPIDDGFWGIELNAGRLPHPEDFGAGFILDPQFRIDQTVDADFIGPLLQAQKKEFAVRRTLNVIGVSDEFFKNWPELKHKINAEVLYEKTLEALGTDQDAIVGEEEFAEILDAIAAKEREKEQLEAGALVADAVPKLGKEIEANSPIAAAV